MKERVDKLLTPSSQEGALTPTGGLNKLDTAGDIKAELTEEGKASPADLKLTNGDTGGTQYSTLHIAFYYPVRHLQGAMLQAHMLISSSLG